MALDFDVLRKANKMRLPEFKNKLGEIAHKTGDVSDWSRSDWFEALIGELCEYSNFSKKYRRGDITKEEFLENAKKELADAQTYLDLLAWRLDIDLGGSTIEKFNEVSERIGGSIFIEDVNGDCLVKDAKTDDFV